MEDSLTKQIDSSTDENLITTRIAVDNAIVLCKLTVTIEERSEMVMKVFKLIQKKYLASPNSKFETNKASIIGTVAKSYVVSVKSGKPNLH